MLPGSSDSSVLCRSVTPRRRTRGPCGLSLSCQPADEIAQQMSLRSPVLVHEVSRRVWGLRLRRTEQELALALLLMLPTAHIRDGGPGVDQPRPRPHQARSRSNLR